ncbi:MAG: MBL fold metallo-hydrolase [Bacilli bacterium]|nr:MBL fold metallo-hydrolase [Bacilli bacterium]
MLDGIICLGHNAIKFSKNNKVIYVDPYKIKDNYNDADIIFITHNHYDHFSKEDILKVKKDSTKIVITEDLYSDTLELGFKDLDIMKVIPNNNYSFADINFSTIRSYNTNKEFHPKENNWVGYKFLFDNYTYYVVGDSDITEESKLVKCDVLFIPIGGVYTTDYKEAAELTNIINPKVVVPVHYGVIVGEKEYASMFKKLVNSSIKCEIMY